MPGLDAAQVTASSAASREHDHLGRFGLELHALPSRHARRLGMLLAQAGLLLTTAALCTSIAAMNIGLVTMLCGCVVARAPFQHAVGAWTLSAYLAWLALSTGVHQEFEQFVRTAVIPIGLVLAQLVLHPAIPGATRLRRLLAWALVLSLMAAVLLALTQFIIGQGGKGPFRIDATKPAFSHTSGFFGHHQNFGSVMSMLFCLATAVMSGLSLPWRGVALGSAVVGVMISGSRAALFALAAGAGVIMALRGGRSLLLGAAACALVLTCGLVALHVLHPGRFQRLVSLEDGRWAIWRASIQVAKDHPLFGTGGTAAFRQAYRDVYPRVVPEIPSEFPRGATTAHHTVLSQVAEHGFPLAILWLAMLVVVGASLWKRRAEHPLVFRAGVGLIVVAVVFGQFEDVDGEPGRALWTGLGILLALSRHPGIGVAHPGGSPVK